MRASSITPRWAAYPGPPCAIGLPIADPLIGLAITVVILRIKWESWRTVRGHDPSPPLGG